MLLHVIVAAVPINPSFRNTPVQRSVEYMRDSVAFIHYIHYGLTAQETRVVRLPARGGIEACRF
jgi:hypothetical protein